MKIIEGGDWKTLKEGTKENRQKKIKERKSIL